MKCTTTREQLLDPVSCTEKTTGKNHTLPVLSCILLTVTKNTLSLTATNLEVGVCYTLTVKDTEDGVVAVSGSVLSHVISSLPSGSSITLKTGEGYLEVKSVGGVSRITLQDTNDFPILPVIEGGGEVTLPAQQLHEAITSVAYCASNSTIKPELSSVFVHANGNELITAATDSFRLAEKRIPLKEAATADPLLIPVRSTIDLLRVLEQVKDIVTLHINEHQLSLTVPGVYITLRLIAGTFPDYTQIIPKEFTTEATILLFDLERALRRAVVFSDQFNQTVVTVSPKNKTFTVYTKNTTIGETTDTVTAALTGDTITISFNQRYLLDALHSISSDSITLQFAGQTQPTVVRPVGDTSFLYLVMPMNR